MSWLKWIKLIDEIAAEIAAASKILAASWKDITVTFGILCICFFAGMLAYVTFEGRQNFADALYSTIIREESAVVTEWDEACPYESVGCEEEKRILVTSTLRTLLVETGGVRAIFGIYANSYRRIAAQVTIVGYEKVPKEYWILPLEPEFTERIFYHRKGVCHVLDVGSVSTDSVLGNALPKFGARWLISCPLYQSDELKGYLSVDYDSPTAPSTDTIDRFSDKLEELLWQ